MTHPSIKADPIGVDARLPLHVRVKDDVTRRIRENEWNAFTALPPEAVLAEQYAISVGTLRRVLTELASEGLLERQQGRGTYIRRASFEHSLFRFFRMQGGQGQPPVSQIMSRNTEKAAPRISKELGVGEHSAVLHLRRLRLWQDIPFLIEDIWLPLPQFQPIADVAVGQLGNLLYPEYETRVGIIIGSATEELSVTQATEPQAELLRCHPNDPLVKVERSARTHSSDVVEFRESFGLASTFHYHVEIN
jgi:GntR family transcriptional regulator